MILRRTLIASPFLLATRPVRAETPAPEAREDEAAQRRPPRLPTPRPVRLRPGAEPVTLEASNSGWGSGGERPGLALRFTGAGAPAEEFRLPSWYGYARVIAVRQMRGRDVVLAAFEGNTGTGTYQEIQAVIGQDDEGTARILALETLHYRLIGPCEGGTWLSIRATPLADGGGLRLDHYWRRQAGNCPPRPGGPARSRAEWGTTLAWSGRGPMRVPAPLRAAPRHRRLVEDSRAKVARWLAQAPRTGVTPDDVEALGLMEVMEAL
ncbi:hypothetical protein GXW74_18525 [Roseomonas eburnea]|uniref:Uncharacterized protein n=1 Tax=Neoroseomonas eburnea TaxID=1346889 RepID=A0A9X9XFK7_9PROT|nr:hypothetical protein [Neoroseomonas eburnea]MBR0682493.1 hypothetical protein [Neoroseomonas eburnea]